MDSLRSFDDADALDGSPGLWTRVLDEMAKRGLPGDLVGAFLESMMRNTLAALDPAMTAIVRAAMRSDAQRGRATYPPGIPPALRHPFFLRAVHLDAIVESLGQSPPDDAWTRLLDRALIRAVARRLRDVPRARERLVDWIGPLQPSRAMQSAVVGVLVALDPTYRPASWVIHLPYVYAPRAAWPRAPLNEATLDDARLSGARLSGAGLARATLRRADLAGANCSGADFSGATLREAVLVDASLKDAILRDADLRGVRATAADFNGADLNDAELDDADLSGVSLRRANLKDASLARTTLDAADLSGAVLAGARCVDVDLRSAILDDVRAADATFVRCRLDGTTIDGLDLTRARLAGCDLTGSRWRRAILPNASLARAGLADVDWEGADLRNVDFTHAAFHMGSSRAGLVFDAPAGEGSRTGFYTHDELEPHLEPEAIRKANLCGTDLRGAAVTGTDWYLVDLRGAHYDADQALWFRRCGAILQDRQ